MEIKFNKAFSIVLIILLLVIYIFGQTLILFFLNIFKPENTDELSIVAIFSTIVSSIFISSANLIIGIWIFIMADKLQQEKWTWTLIGMAFGQYSLIFLTLMLIIQGEKLKIDLFNTFCSLLILLVISILLRLASTYSGTQFLDRILDASYFNMLIKYTAYLPFGIYGIKILVNGVLASKLYGFIDQLQAKGKLLWAIFTVFLGLFPVILFNELILIKVKK